MINGENIVKQAIFYIEQCEDVSSEGLATTDCDDWRYAESRKEISAAFFLANGALDSASLDTRDADYIKRAARRTLEELI
jgi:hypothetical protein